MNTELTPRESTMATHYGFGDAYTQYLRDYKALHPIRQNVLRAIARQMLRAADLPEYGSSDVSCQVFNIWKNVGGFSNENFNDILTDLRDEWLGWAALPGEAE